MTKEPILYNTLLAPVKNLRGGDWETCLVLRFSFQSSSRILRYLSSPKCTKIIQCVST